MDRYLIVDTGSSDNTIQIVHQIMTEIPGTVQSGSFIGGFGPTRTRALELARRKDNVCKFHLMMSGEETLVNGEVLGEFVERLLWFDANENISSEHCVKNPYGGLGAYNVEIDFGGSQRYQSPRLTAGSYRYCGCNEAKYGTCHAMFCKNP